MSYVTVAAYRENVASVRTDNDAAIWRDVSAASDLVERLCNRVFGGRYADVGATTVTPREVGDQLAYGRGTAWLRLKSPVYGVVVVREDSATGDVVDAAGYRLLSPHDGLSYHLLKRTDGRVWRAGEAYNVNAIEGTAETPALVEQAVLELAAIERLESPRSFNVFTEYGTDEKRTSTEANRYASFKLGMREYAVYRP